MSEQHMEQLKYGFRIKHKWLGRTQEVIVNFDKDEGRLRLIVTGREIYLTPEETEYFLSQFDMLLSMEIE